MYANLVEALEANLSDDRGITFINGDKDEGFLSYRQLHDRALGILHDLQCKGVVAGTEVLLQVPDNERLVCFAWACLLGGLVPVPITVGNTPEHKLRVLNAWRRLKRPCLVTTRDVLGTFEPFRATQSHAGVLGEMSARTFLAEELHGTVAQGTISRAHLDGPAFIMFSSGSTGDPKGVVLTHRSILSNAKDLATRWDMTSRDVSLHFTSLTHTVGIVFCHFLPIATCTNQFLMSLPLFLRDPLLWLSKVSQHRATNVLVNPFAMRHVLASTRSGAMPRCDLSSVRIVTFGGEHISHDLVAEFSRTLSAHGLRENVMVPVYGITEAMVVACGAPGEPVKTASLDRKLLFVGDRIKEVEDGLTFVDLGSPPDDCQVRICDAQDKELGESTIGCIQVKGSNVTCGYHGDEVATNSAFTEDGWFRTGDLGFVRDSRVTIVGREKDVVTVNVQNYYLFDIERVGEAVEGVRPGTVAACGVLNGKTMNDEVVLFVAHEGTLEEFVPLAVRIRKQVSRRTGLVVRHVIPAAEIPRTVLGKFNRQKLKAMFEEAAVQSTVEKIDRLLGQEERQEGLGLAGDEVSKLQAIWTRLLGVGKVGAEDNFFELGGQSIKVVEMAEEIRREFGLDVELRTLYEAATLNTLAEHIRTSRER